MSNTPRHVELERNLLPISERLEDRFNAIDPWIVKAVVGQCAAQFEHARVQAYVCVLTEKMAKERLQTLERMTQGGCCADGCLLHVDLPSEGIVDLTDHGRPRVECGGRR